MVTPKANTGTVTNTNWGLHKDTGPETDVFVRDKLCLLPVSPEGPLRNFVLSNSRGCFRGPLEDTSPTARLTFSPHLGPETL